MRRLISLIVSLALSCSVCFAGEISSASPQVDILQLVNEFRQQRGISPLARNANLEAAAQAYAVTLATQAEFSHTAGGTTAPGRANAAGYPGSYVGENIARGFFDPPSVMLAWENSPGHLANLVNPSYTELGVGNAPGQFGQSWVQDFGRSSPPPVTPPVVIIPPSPPIVPPVTPPPPVAPVVSLVGKFGMYKDNLGNYFLLPIQ